MLPKVPKRIWLISLIAIGWVCVSRPVKADDWGDDQFSADYDESWLTGKKVNVHRDYDLWSVSLSAGKSWVNNINSHISCPDTLSIVEFNNTVSLLSFPAREFDVTHASPGVSILAEADRHFTSALSI